MKNRFLIVILILSAGSLQAGDNLNGDTLIRSISAGEGSLVLFQNPMNEPARTLVSCVPSSEIAKKSLSDDQMGGIMIISGSTMILKKDSSNAFNDGSNLKGDYIQIECK